MHILYLYIYTLCMGVYIYIIILYMTGREREMSTSMCISLFMYVYLSIYICIQIYVYKSMYMYIYNTSVQSIVVICEARMASLIKKQNTRTCTWLSSNDGARPTIPRTPSPHLPNSMVSVVEDPMES